MKISKQELDRIIKEEMEAAIDEGFLDSVKSAGSRVGSKVAGAFGADTASREMGSKADSLRDKSAAEKAAKKASRAAKKSVKKGAQTYPATELTTLLRKLQLAIKKSGVRFPGPRGSMVDAFEKILNSKGYSINEADERVFIGQDGNIEISKATAPSIVSWLEQVKEKAPDVFANLTRELANYRFDIPAELAASEDTGSEEEETPEPEGVPGSEEEGGATPPGSPAEEEERETVALFKGKGGVSLQSFIDRLGGDDPEIKGVVRSTVLKHISNQMKKQGVQIVEDEGSTDYSMIAEEFLDSLDEAAVAIYNHPAGKGHSLNGALQKLRADGSTGIEKEKLGKLLDALARWAKSQGLKVNEGAPPSHSLQESIRVKRWKVLSGIR